MPIRYFVSMAWLLTVVALFNEYGNFGEFVADVNVRSVCGLALFISLSVNMVLFDQHWRSGSPPRWLLPFLVLNMAGFVLVFAPFPWWRH